MADMRQLDRAQSRVRRDSQRLTLPKMRVMTTPGSTWARSFKRRVKRAVSRSHRQMEQHLIDYEKEEAGI